MTGGLFVVSGPSGAGKDTLLSRVLPRLEHVWLSVSATTRKPRQGEQDGVHYFFLSNEQFDKLIAVDGLLEWASVHGERYGTIRSEVCERLEQGIDVVLEIDPQGAFLVQEKMPDAKMVFIAPPSLAVLEQRLRQRGTEDEAAVTKRLANAIDEMASSSRYQWLIVNDDLDSAAEQLYQLLSAHSSLSA
jgi:guanylate kinase